MPEFEPRKVPAGTEVTYTGREGEQIVMRSRKHSSGAHVIEPKDGNGEAALIGQGFPVVRRKAATKRTRAATRSSRTRSTRVSAPAPAPAAEPTDTAAADKE
jgi:hypothetical protein